VEDHSSRAAAKALKGFADFHPNEIDTGADIFVRRPDIFAGRGGDTLRVSSILSGTCLDPTGLSAGRSATILPSYSSARKYEPQN